ncbi:MAG: efflux RND transporter periplasmic adaptor subunit [Phycisphaerales bacterium]|nr:efflux RND transporter periplasmic adaptor subunit [Phycisphaerales bacterium]
MSTAAITVDRDASIRARRRACAGAILTVLILAPALADSPPVDADQSDFIVGLSAPSRDALLSIDFDARIHDIRAREGQCVDTGAPLIQFDDETQRIRCEVARFQAESTLDLDLAKIRVDHAEAELKRIEGLTGSTSAKELLDARLAAEAAHIEQSIAQLKHAQAERDYQLQKQLLAERTLTAPFEGLIALVEGEVGETVSRGAPIVRLVKLHPLTVTFSCPLEIAQGLSRGQPVDLRVPLPGAAARVGNIEFVSPVVDPASQMVTVRVTVGNDAHDWPAGVQVEMRVLKREPVATVATAATGGHE